MKPSKRPKTAITKDGESSGHGTWKMKKTQTWKNAGIKGVKKLKSATDEVQWGS